MSNNRSVVPGCDARRTGTSPPRWVQSFHEPLPCHCCAKHLVDGIRAIAVFEAAKGLLVLAAGFGLLGLLHRGPNPSAA
jgi:hypothetical protein